MTHNSKTTVRKIASYTYLSHLSTLVDRQTLDLHAHSLHSILLSLLYHPKTVGNPISSPPSALQRNKYNLQSKAAHTQLHNLTTSHPSPLPSLISTAVHHQTHTVLPTLPIPPPFPPYLPIPSHQRPPRPTELFLPSPPLGMPATPRGAGRHSIPIHGPIPEDLSVWRETGLQGLEGMGW